MSTASSVPGRAGRGGSCWRSIAARSCSRSAPTGRCSSTRASRPPTTTRRSIGRRPTTVERLAARGLETRVVSQRLNRRKIDLIPLPEWADPPKARIDELVRAVTDASRRGRDLRTAGGRGDRGGRGERCRLARAEDHERRQARRDRFDRQGRLARVRCSPSCAATASRPSSCSSRGDEFGELGRHAGERLADARARGARATAFSVGVEPSGVPAGVSAPAGWAGALHRGAARSAAAACATCRGSRPSRDGRSWSTASTPTPSGAIDALLTHRRRRDRHLGRAAARSSADARAEVLVRRSLRR